MLMDVKTLAAAAGMAALGVGAVAAGGVALYQLGEVRGDIAAHVTSSGHRATEDRVARLEAAHERDQADLATLRAASDVYGRNLVRMCTALNVAGCESPPTRGQP